MGVCGGVCVLVIGFLVWFIATRDTWELDNASRVSAKLEEADRLQQSDPFAAYKAYDEVIKETKQHKIKEEQLAKRLANAEKSQAALYPKVQKKVRAEEAEKQRRVEEEARRVAVAKQRVAEEEERKHAAEEAQRLAEEKERAEEKRRKEAVSVYCDAPQSARNVLNMLKKLQARTEVGITYADYLRAVGETWGDVKIFAESPDGKKLPELSLLAVKIAGDYETASKAWHWEIEWSFDKSSKTFIALGRLQQACWSRAVMRLRLAESLLNAGEVEEALKTIAADKGHDEDFNAKLDSILSGK